MTTDNGPQRQPTTQPGGLTDVAMSAVRELESITSDLLKRAGYQQSQATDHGSVGGETSGQRPANGFTPLLGNAADPAASILDAMATALAASATAMATIINDVSGALTGSGQTTTGPPGSADPGSVQPLRHSDIGLIATNGNRGGVATAIVAVTNEVTTVVPNVTLTTTDLCSPDDHSIPASAILVAPDFLTLDPGQTGNFQITVVLDDAIRPGVYSGVIGTGTLAEVRAVLQVEVNA